MFGTDIDHIIKIVLTTFVFSVLIMPLMKSIAHHIGAIDIPRNVEENRHIHKKPIPKLGGLGILAIFISFVILIYALISYIFNLNTLTPGWTSLMVSITFFSGIQLISISISSEYIGRIYDETKQRPQYIINKKINID